MNKKTMQGMSLWSMIFLLASGAIIYKAITPKKNQEGEVVGQSPLQNMFSPAQAYQAILQIKELSKACEMYMIDAGDYPPNLEALIKNTGSKDWVGPYMQVKKIPHDPWVQAYQYKYPGDHYAYDLYSYGADKKLGGEGDNADITNWDIQAKSK